MDLLCPGLGEYKEGPTYGDHAVDLLCPGLGEYKEGPTYAVDLLCPGLGEYKEGPTYIWRPCSGLTVSRSRGI